MKLIFDHHLSRKLVTRLADLFPNSTHVALHAMDDAEDSEIWHYAKQEEYTIVTKDSDFNDLSALYSSPPKVIWIRLGNCTTATVELLIRQYAQSIQSFIEESADHVLEIIPFSLH